MACNCKKNTKPVRTVVKKINTSNTTVNKSENGGTKIIRRNLKW